MGPSALINQSWISSICRMRSHQGSPTPSTLTDEEARQSEQSPHPDSMELYFRGKAEFNKAGTPEHLARAKSIFEQALSVERPSIPAIFAALAQDGGRNDLVIDEVLKSLEAKRSSIVLTKRKDHLDYLQKRFSPFVRNRVVLRGGMSAKESKVAAAALSVADRDERLIPATGRYVGEGLDDARLDTLFLTMPIAWKGMLAQSVGRHRLHDGKKDVLVVDYVDQAVPVFARMAAKRRAGYRALDYVSETADTLQEAQPSSSWAD